MKLTVSKLIMTIAVIIFVTSVLFASYTFFMSKSNNEEYSNNNTQENINEPINSNEENIDNNKTKENENKEINEQQSNENKDGQTNKDDSKDVIIDNDKNNNEEQHENNQEISIQNPTNETNNKEDNNTKPTETKPNNSNNTNTNNTNNNEEPKPIEQQPNNTTNNEQPQSNPQTEPVVEKTTKEKIELAYSKAAAKGISLSNFSSQLKDIFGKDRFKLYDNETSWMVEIVKDNTIEVISTKGVFEDYLIPEKDCGAKGDGVTDDTNAIKKCLESSKKNIVLKGNYLITSNIETSLEKNLFGGKFIFAIKNSNRGLTFRNIVRFNSTTLTSNIKTTGTSPHKETYTNTSNIDFVEAWGKSSRFVNCRFENALRAIRGRISTGATVVPEKLYVDNSTFIECKAPIQGYFANITVNNTNFKNNGDLYSGDHAIYIESYGSKNLTIKNSNVEVYNTESGAAFQIYGKKSNSKPVINISNCNIKANGIVSSDLASVTISNTNFTSQHKTRYVVTIESGDVLMDKCKINHDYFLAKYPDTPVIAKNSEFKLNKVSGASRAFFPKESVNCKFINWGGYVLYPDTKITNSIFTRDSDHVVGKYYIGIGSGYNILIEKSSFKRGDDISYNSSGTIHLKECHYINKIGTNVPNVIEEGIIHDDIVS